MTKKVVLNLAERRQKQEILVVTDQFGKDHELRLTLAGFAQIMNMQGRYQEVLTQLRSSGEVGEETQQSMIDVLGSLITSLLPRFPVSGLEFDELFALFSVIQDVSSSLFNSPGGKQKVEADPNP